PVAPQIPADQANCLKLLQFVLKVFRRVRFTLTTDRPQLPVDDRGLVGEPATVVGVGGHAVEGAFGVDADERQSLGLERLRLEAADTSHRVGRPSNEVANRGRSGTSRRGPGRTGLCLAAGATDAAGGERRSRRAAWGRGRP